MAELLAERRVTRAFLKLQACQYVQALRFTAQKAQEGAVGLRPNAKERQVLGDLPTLVRVMNATSCMMGKDELKGQELLALQQWVLALMGFKL